MARRTRRRNAFKQEKRPWRRGVEISGAPKGTRTPNLLIRSQMLYPIELSAQPKGRRLCHKGVFGASPGMN